MSAVIGRQVSVVTGEGRELVGGVVETRAQPLAEDEVDTALLTICARSSARMSGS